MIRNVKPDLYLEGIKVPAYAATVNAFDGVMHTANIAITSDKDPGFRPRTHVGLTFLDPLSRKEVVLFEGELYSSGKSRGAKGNAFNIGAVDVASYLASARPYYIDANFYSPDSLALAFLLSNSKIVDAFANNSGFLDKSFQATLDILFSASGGLLDFFKNSDERLLLSQRLGGASGVWPISGKQLRDYLENIIRQYGYHSIVDLFGATSTLIKHKLISISAPADREFQLGARQQLPPLTWAVVPDLFYALPPMCNVIFPNQIKNFDHSSAFLSQITRVIVNDSPLERTRRLVGEPEPKQNITVLPDTLSIEDETRDYTDATIEEQEKGPVPSSANIVTIPRNATQEYRDQFSDFVFRKMQLSDSKLTGDILFTPYMVPGLPAIIVDKDGTALHGYLESAVHTIQKGNVFTSIVMSHVQPLQKLTKYDPPFADTNWTFDNVGDGYRSILSSSVQSISERFGTSDPETLIEKVLEISGNGDNAVASEIFRPIIDVENFFRSLGSTPNSDLTAYSGTTFVGQSASLASASVSDEITEPQGDQIPDKQAIVLNYLERIKNRRT